MDSLALFPGLSHLSILMLHAEKHGDEEIDLCCDCSTCISGDVFSCEPGSKNYKHRSTDILLSICGELHLQSEVEMVLKKHKIVYEV